MRKFLMIIGGLALAVVVIAGGALGYVVYRGFRLDAESRAYVDAAVPAIAAQWNLQELRDRAAPELLATVTPKDWQAIADAGSRLSPLVAYLGAKGDSLMSYHTGSGSTITARYVATVQCKYASATIRITLLKHGTSWSISGFFIDRTDQSPSTHST